MAAWLTVTFFQDVPSQRYPRLEKYESVTALTPVPVAPASAVEDRLLPVSVSR